MAKSLAEVMHEATQGPSIAQRLERRLGTGTNPEVRRQLYQRVETVVLERGEGALACIDSVIADAAGKDDPGRYFAAVVLKRLCERGFIDMKTHVDW